MKPKKKNLFYTLLKITITVFLLYLVFTRIPFSQISDTLKRVNIIFLVLALVLFVGSQWVSAKRLLVLFYATGFLLNPVSNYILYLIGMFYNFFIPGGIGGDAYKVFKLNKAFNWPVKKLTGAIFIDRFMGLTAIGVLILLFAAFIPFVIQENLRWILPILLILGVLISFLFVKYMFKSFFNVYWLTLLQSIVVQVLQCASVIFLLAAISNLDNFLLYVLVFLISSVLSIFSFSGIGVREIIFYQASSWFLFNSTVAVTIGLLFSAITAFVSLFGIVFHFKKSSFYIKQDLVKS
ncbi:lysylphosphatidylglycerol synthase transmembrane domain-containing protein [Postechiella marina]|uniref:lysylphosphatidylglycerol synthase transmembrane domain-containing protein n=1 Tax=Postechiella marina TaxID=943941 RepID=UPI0031D579BB